MLLVRFRLLVRQEAAMSIQGDHIKVGNVVRASIPKEKKRQQGGGAQWVCARASSGKRLLKLDPSSCATSQVKKYLL